MQVLGISNRHVSFALTLSCVLLSFFLIWDFQLAVKLLRNRKLMKRFTFFRINHWIPTSSPRIYQDSSIELAHTEETQPHILRLLFTVKGKKYSNLVGQLRFSMAIFLISKVLTTWVFSSLLSRTSNLRPGASVMRYWLGRIGKMTGLHTTYFIHTDYPQRVGSFGLNWQ